MTDSVKLRRTPQNSAELRRTPQNSTPAKFHRVQLSLEETHRRWPARDAIEKLYRGFAHDQAKADGWTVLSWPRSYHYVEKVLPCDGDRCSLCDHTMAADEVA